MEFSGTKVARALVGGLIVTGYFTTFGMILIRGGALGAETVRDLLFLYVGALIGSFTSVVAFYYGTTQSSASKDHTIKELAKKEPTP